MSLDADSHFLIICKDDGDHEHMIRVKRSESNARIMDLHACLVRHGFQARIFQPVEWSSATNQAE